MYSNLNSNVLDS